MKIKVGKVSVELIDAYDRVCMHIRKGGTFEPQSLAAWGDLCARGGTILDIGAYTGLFAISAALYRCRALAFEPMPFNAERLRENAKRNRVAGEVELFPVAVADYVGTGTITHSLGVNGFTSGASLRRRNGVQSEVPITTIDALQLDQVTAIKIDVERGEPQVWHGARDTLARCRPVVLAEVNDDEAKAALMSSICADGMPPYNVAAELDVRNWLLLPC